MGPLIHFPRLLHAWPEHGVGSIIVSGAAATAHESARLSRAHETKPARRSQSQNAASVPIA